MVTAYKIIGAKDNRRKEGFAKASGKAVYTRDFTLPGMLYARVLASPYAHVHIKSMDTTAAAALPGVRYVLRYDDTGSDMHGMVSVTGPAGAPNVMDNRFALFLKGARLSHWNQGAYPLLGDWATCGLAKLGVAVVADSEDIAAEALSLVKVVWEPLPFVIDAHEAMKTGAPIANPDNQAIMIPGTNLCDISAIPAANAPDISYGDVDKALAATDIQKITWTTTQMPQHMCGAEPSGCVARWNDGGKTLEMWAHTQHPEDVHTYVNTWFGSVLPRANLKSNLCYQGGMFGEGSEDGPQKFYPQMYVLNAILAKRTGRPVKLMYDRRDSQVCFTFINYEPTFTVGFKSDGTITAVDIKALSWNSYQALLSHLRDATSIQNMRVTNTFVDTNMGSTWAFRCEIQGPDFVFNQVFDHVAAALNMDPTAVATKNNGNEGDGVQVILDTLKANNFPVVNSLQTCMAAGKAAIGWDSKWHTAGSKKLPNGRMHGMGFHWSPQWSDLPGVGYMQIAFQPDGTCRLNGQHADVGLNAPTWCCQIVAEEVGMKYDDVVPNFFDDIGFGQATPDSSMDLTRNGWVWQKVAREAKKQLLALAVTNATFTAAKVTSADQLDIQDSVVFVKATPTVTLPLSSLLATRTLGGEGGANPFIVQLQVNQMPVPWGTGGKGSKEFCRQGHFGEVEVDTETGEVVITNFVTTNDVGKVINYGSCLGQLSGGAIMGMSRGKSEDPVWDPITGGVLTDNMIDNHVMTCLDYPATMQNIPIETETGRGPYGSCGCGESNSTLMTEYFEGAIQNAIGVWVGKYPVTPLNVLKALGKA